MLELKSVSKAYEGMPLLDSISFTLEAGETICLLGASGSGKSTLLRMIAGLESPDNGLILFNGIDLAPTPPHLRDFSLVFQDYGLFPHLNVFDNVAFGLRMRNTSPADVGPRVAELLSQMNLSGMVKRKVTDLSGGEQQRVALARALAPQPRLLMFDEPLGALDRSLKEELLNELRDILQRTEIPAIYVTHDQEEAFSIADRILFLHDGLIVRDGTPSDVWNDPGSAWVARFLGVGNVIQGVVTAMDKVKTEYGIFELNCTHRHVRGQEVPLLLKQSRGAGTREVLLRVEDVAFKREQYRVRARGGIIIHTRDKPQAGQRLTICMKVECLS